MGPYGHFEVTVMHIEEIAVIFDIYGNLCQAHGNRASIISFNCTVLEAFLFLSPKAVTFLYALIHDEEKILHTGEKKPCVFGLYRLNTIRVSDKIGERPCALSISHLFVWTAGLAVLLIVDPELCEINFSVLSWVLLDHHCMGASEGKGCDLELCCEHLSFWFLILII